MLRSRLKYSLCWGVGFSVAVQACTSSRPDFGTSTGNTEDSSASTSETSDAGATTSTNDDAGGERTSALDGDTSSSNITLAENSSSLSSIGVGTTSLDDDDAGSTQDVDADSSDMTGTDGRVDASVGTKPNLSDSGCEDECALDDSLCQNGEVARCEQGVDGCWSWLAMDACESGSCQDEHKCANVPDVILFESVGFLPGANSSRALTVSGDGTYVAGTSGDSASTTTNRPFFWRDGTITQLGEESAHGSAIGSNFDGSLFIGTAWFDGGERAARWDRAGNLYVLDGVRNKVSGFYPSEGIATSNTGSVFSGVCEDRGLRKACRWVDGDPEPELVAPPSPYVSADTFVAGMSVNGLVIVGYTQSPDASFAWTSEEFRVLSGSDDPSNPAQAAAVTDDGQLIFGNLSGGGMVRWSGADAPTVISFDGTVTDVNSDGSVVIGHKSLAGSVIWTEADGSRSLDEVLVELGADLTGWTLNAAMAVSSSGKVIVGWGTHGGTREGWIARLP